MTEIAFHFNVPDKLQYSCRLLRKAWAGGNKVVVTGEPDLLAELDRLLWQFSPTEFIPHCRMEAPESQRAVTPVLLAPSLAGCPPDSVLVNLGAQVPAEFERFERFIEVVSQHGDDRLAGRSRWKHYADRGYALKRHDLASGQGA